jgi:tRNA(fMet)-specific endonuclease VapC
MNFLLDTCVISEFRVREPNPRVLEWLRGLDDRSAYLSVITIGEIRKGIERLSDPARKQALSVWLENELLVRFGDRLADIDLNVALTWGELVGRLNKAGRVLPAMDSLVAATALRRGLVIATRYKADFEGTGVALFDPWSE